MILYSGRNPLINYSRIQPDVKELNSFVDLDKIDHVRVSTVPADTSRYRIQKYAEFRLYRKTIYLELPIYGTEYSDYYDEYYGEEAYIEFIRYGDSSKPLLTSTHRIKLMIL